MAESTDKVQTASGDRYGVNLAFSPDLAFCSSTAFPPGTIQSNPIQSSSIQTSSVRCNPIQTSRVRFSPILSSPVQSSRVQFNPVESSSILSSSFQSSPVHFNVFQPEEAFISFHDYTYIFLNFTTIYPCITSPKM